jgi:hypothetical protein
VAAYGIADAEHQVEKELRRLWPEARVRVQDVHRTGPEGRIAEVFAVGYRLEGRVEVDAADADGARREAFRRARAKLEGSRYWSTAWDEAVPES